MGNYDDWNGEVKNLDFRHGDCIEIMQDLETNSIDAIITDPPYMINLANRSWDSEFDVESWAAQCFRVLKHGGYMACFGATRTIHRFAYMLEGAGFDVKDMLSWVYFEGMPHSHDVSLAIDKALGVESTPIGEFKNPDRSLATNESTKTGGYNDPDRKTWIKKTATSEQAKAYTGYGTGLKPCHEPILLLKKPIKEKNIALNILKYGTGALNIQACRHDSNDKMWLGPSHDHVKHWHRKQSVGTYDGGGQFQDNQIRTRVHVQDISSYAPVGGRWPANVLHCSKPRHKEKEAGLSHLLQGKITDEHTQSERANFHLTVKPLSVIRWLCRLLSPPNGVILDPFLGSGTTAAASILEGHDVIGMEITKKYYPIIDGRVAWARDEYKKENAQQKLF